MNEVKEILLPKSTIAWICAGFVLLFLVFVVWTSFGCKAYNRYQKREDAKNEVQVRKTQIQTAQQQVEIERQEARAKVVEAHGIRASQDIINETLTPLYVQHEAVQAQEALVNSPTHSQIYIPSGNNGVPLVKPVQP